MSISVRYLLSTPEFNDFAVLAGEPGLDRIVTSVSVMDAPDIHHWLKGGEILITTGYILKDDTNKFIDLITNINEAGAAALFIKIKRFIDQLPAAVLELADELKFPIVLMPIQLAFTDVINPVLAKIVNEQTRKLQISENIHKSFTKLVLSGGNTEQIVQTLGKILAGDVAYLDIYFQKQYLAARTPAFRNAILHSTLDEIMATYKYYPVRVDSKIFGYIIYTGDQPESYLAEGSDIALEHAGTVLQLDIQKKISNLEIEYRYKNEFVQDLITNNIKYYDEAQNRAKLYGWNFDRGITAVVVEILDFKKNYRAVGQEQTIKSLENTREKIFRTCKMFIHKTFDQLIFTSLSDSITFLVAPPAAEGGLDKFYGRIAEVSGKLQAGIRKKHGFSVMVGVGEHRQSIMDIHASYKEALKAVKIGKILKSNKIVFYQDIGVYRLLEAIYNTNEAQEFCRLSVGKLLHHDEKYRSDLFKTLICISDCNWNLKKTAQVMYLHYNTIKYRYKKIEEILSVDLEDSEERFVILMSIKLMRMANELFFEDINLKKN